MENGYLAFINSQIALSGVENERYKLPPKHLERLSAALDELKRLPVSKIILYGSCARSAAKYNSDIDIALIARDFSSDTHREIRRLRSDYQDGKGPDVDIHCISEDNYANGESWFVQNVRKDGIVLWKK